MKIANEIKQIFEAIFKDNDMEMELDLKIKISKKEGCDEKGTNSNTD